MDLQKKKSKKFFAKVRVQLLHMPEVALGLEEKDVSCDLLCLNLRTAGPLRLRLHFTLQDRIYRH